MDSSVFGLCKALLASGAFRRNMLEPFFLGRKPAWVTFGQGQQDTICSGLKKHFQITPEKPDMASWAHAIHAALFSPRFVRAFGHADHPMAHTQLRDSLSACLSVPAPTYIGDIESSSATSITGFALDTADRDKALTLDIVVNNDFVGTVTTGTQRRDIQERHGGNGLSGFQLDIHLPPHLAGLENFVVHAFEQESGFAICAGREVPNIGARHEHHLSRLIGELGMLRADPGTQNTDVMACLQRIESKLPDIRAYAALPLKDYDVHARLFVPPAPPAATPANLDAAILDPATVPEALEGDILLFRGADEKLADGATAHILKAASDNPEACIFFADHDTRDENGTALSPVFKAAFDYDQLLSRPDYATAYAVRKDAFLATGGFSAGAGLAQHQDLWLRIHERHGDSAFHHVPCMLWHKAPDTPRPTTADSIPVLMSHFERLDIPAKAAPYQDSWGGNETHLVSVEWPIPDTVPSLAVIIPTRNGLAMTKACVESLQQTLAHPDQTEIVIMDNGSSDSAMLEWLTDIDRAHGIRVIRHDAPFNWSALNNLAVQATDTDYLLFLNNDTCATEDGWDHILRGQLGRPDIGTVGARLFFEDRTIQFGGYILDKDRIAVKEAYGESPLDCGYLNRSKTPHQCGALIGAFLACSRETFQRLGGFDENFAVAFNDIDFTIRASALGLRNLYCPDISFYHFESKSRGYDAMDADKKAREQEERTLLKAKHDKAFQHDPHYPEAFMPIEPAYSLLAPPPYNRQ